MGILLFNIIFAWQPFNTRFHTGAFVLFAPLVGLSFYRNKSGIVLGVLLILHALPWVLLNESRPMVGEKSIFKMDRNAQYFANNPGFQYSYQKAVAVLNAQNCSQVGLIMGSDSWEYPLWPLFDANNNDQLRLEHVHGENTSFAKYNIPPFNTFVPCALITEGLAGTPSLRIQDKNYVQTRQFAFLQIFRHDPEGVLAKKSISFNFQKYLQQAQQSNVLIKKMNKGLNQTDIQKILALRKEELKKAEFIDPMLLNEIYKGLGDQFEKDLKQGLKLVINGYETKHQKNYEEGQRHLRRWNIWLSRNLARIQKAFGNLE